LRRRQLLLELHAAHLLFAHALRERDRASREHESAAQGERAHAAK
jgi:hypothetical protein